jgi:hypothetical protein
MQQQVSISLDANTVVADAAVGSQLDYKGEKLAS